MRRPTYRQAIEGVESKDPKQRVIGLVTISKGLRWRGRAKSLGLNWKGKVLQHQNIEKLIEKFRKCPPDAQLKLKYELGVKGLLAECDYKKYYQRIKEWERHLKANKKRLNDRQKVEKKLGIENVRKAFTVIKSILKEYGIKPTNWKEVIEGKGIGQLEYELSPATVLKSSRIGAESRRRKRILKLQERLNKYAPFGVDSLDGLADRIIEIMGKP